MRIVDLLERDARLYPLETAVAVVGGPQLTYRELRSRALCLAGALAGLGVGAGDRVALLADNGLAPFEVLLATAHLGAAVVPLGTRLTRPELEQILGDAEPTVALADAAHADALAAC